MDSQTALPLHFDSLESLMKGFFERVGSRQRDRTVFWIYPRTRKVIRPLVRSYGEISTFTRSPGMIRM